MSIISVISVMYNDRKVEFLQRIIEGKHFLLFAILFFIE